MGFAEAVTVEQNLVARLEIRIARRLDRARQIDAPDHRKLAHDRGTPGERQAILEVDRGMRDSDDDIPFHQIVQAKFSQFGLLARVVLGDQEGPETIFHVRNFHQLRRVGGKAQEFTLSVKNFR